LTLSQYIAEYPAAGSLKDNYQNMIRRILIAGLLLVLIAAVVIGWRFFASDTGFSGKTKYLYIRTGAATKEAVLQSRIHW
jgi:hypothetical protein